MKTYQVCLLCLSFVVCGVPAHAKVATGDVPVIETSSLDGKPVSRATLAGKVVLVDFWATWCSPCGKSFAFYDELAAKYGEQGLVVVAMSVDEDRERVRKFVERHQVPFIVVVDDRLTLAKQFEPPAMPTAYLLDRRGKVRHVHPGFKAADRDEVERELRRLLAEPAS